MTKRGKNHRSLRSTTGTHVKFGASQIEMKRFLGQDWVVTGRGKRGKTKWFDLMGASGTELEGVLLKGITSQALAKFRDDKDVGEWEKQNSVPEMS